MAPQRFNNRRGFGGNRFRGRITDARQILQRRNVRQNVTDLSEKLVSRNSITARLGPGNFRNNRINKPRFYNNNNNLRMNRNRFQNQMSMRGNQTYQNVVPNRPRQQYPNVNRNQLPQNKYVQVHRNGITVTARQNTFQRRQKMVANDELEEMTLEDLPELESVNKGSRQNLEIRSQTLTSNSNTTVLVSNLKHTVTEEDLNELFGVVGTLSQVQMLHPGTALVTYYHKEEALSAVESYHNVTLDGMPMHCSILSIENTTGKPSISSRLGERASLPISASFLSPPQRGVASYIPQSFPTYPVARSRQVHPQFTTKPLHHPKFTISLN